MNSITYSIITVSLYAKFSWARYGQELYPSLYIIIIVYVNYRMRHNVQSFYVRCKVCFIVQLWFFKKFYCINIQNYMTLTNFLWIRWRWAVEQWYNLTLILNTDTQYTSKLVNQGLWLRSSMTNNDSYRLNVNVSLQLIYTLRPKINVVADIVGHNSVLD